MYALMKHQGGNIYNKAALNQVMCPLMKYKNGGNVYIDLSTLLAIVNIAAITFYKYSPYKIMQN